MMGVSITRRSPAFAFGFGGQASRLGRYGGWKDRTAEGGRQ